MQFDAVVSHAGGRVALRSMLPLVSLTAPRTWVQIAVEGRWSGYRDTSFELDQDVFANMIRLFQEQENPLPVKLEHPEPNHGDHSAFGWIHELAVRGNELWAFVEFTGPGAELVRQGAYRFCSMVVDFESVDRETGEEAGPKLHELGLTNTPFLDGMEPIRLSRVSGAAPPIATARRSSVMAMTDAELIKRASKELGDKITIESLVRLVTFEKEKQAILDGTTAEPAPAPEVAAAAEPVAAADVPAAPAALADDVLDPAAAAGATDDVSAMVIDKLATMLGVDSVAAAAFIDEHIDEIAALGTAASVEDDATLSEANKAINELSTRVKASDAAVAKLTAENKSLSIQSRIDKAVVAGSVLEEQRDYLVELGQVSDSLFMKQLTAHAKNPTVPKANMAGKPPTKTGDDDVPEVDKESSAYIQMSAGLGELRQFKGPANAKKLHEHVARKLTALQDRRAS